MTKYILHGGYTKEDNESNQAFFVEFFKDVPDNGTVLFVYFATRIDEEIPEKFREHVKICEKFSTERNLNFKIATQENFLEQLKESDALLFNGGSTSKLLRVLCEYPDLKPLVTGKTVAGSSAGAYILATLGASHSEEVVREGLGFVPLRVICHYESPTLPPSMASVANLKEISPDLELVILRDYEWRVFRY